MTNLSFSKATKTQSRLRLALIGPSGSGKTYTALTIAQYLGQRVAVIDTERGSASKYADIFTFDVLNLETFSPLTYVEAIKAAEAAGYDVLVIDSLSHAWMGKDGALEQVDSSTKRSQSRNSYTAWREVTPMHNALIDAMLQSGCHIIGTMRTKTEYVIEEDERGKKVPRKVGMAPVQRDGLEYEFDVVGDMDLENNFLVSKTRCPALAGKVFKKPGKPLADILHAWLSDGATPPPPPENSGLRVDIPATSAPSVRTSNTTDAAPEPKPAPTNGNGHDTAPVYAGTTCKIGKNTYPYEWGVAFADPKVGIFGRIKPPHVDGILQKLELDPHTRADVVRSILVAYEDAKDRGADPVAAANDRYVAAAEGLDELG